MATREDVRALHEVQENMRRQMEKHMVQHELQLRELRKMVHHMCAASMNGRQRKQPSKEAGRWQPTRVGADDGTCTVILRI